MSLADAVRHSDKGVCYIISADDLRSVVRELFRDEQRRTEEAVAASREMPTVTKAEAAKMLNVAQSTLWRWAKEGYLTPVKVGAKVLYRASDIDRLLHRKEKGGAK